MYRNRFQEMFLVHTRAQRIALMERNFDLNYGCATLFEKEQHLSEKLKSKYRLECNIVNPSLVLQRCSKAHTLKPERTNTFGARVKQGPIESETVAVAAMR